MYMVNKQKTELKKSEKYKHKDEDVWKRENPGKEFKPFDPERDVKE